MRTDVRTDVQTNVQPTRHSSLLLSSIVLFIFTASIPLAAQAPAQTPAPPSPQTARQALIEMFFGKGENDFTKHLPDEARQTLIRKGETERTSVVLRISTIGRQLAAEGGGHIETFDEGATLLVTEPTPGHEKIEAVVEHDNLLGEEDEIELSFHYYKEGQLQSLPVVPRLTFTLKQEKEIWRLTEVTAAAHIPLTDPDYLQELRREQNEANEGAAQNRVNAIAASETGYAAQHPDLGYTCTLANLFPQVPATENEPSPYAEDASEESNGYRFAITGCVGTPASKFRVSAVPSDADAGQKTFCSDASGTLKFTTDGKSSTCFSEGQPVNPPARRE
jgi:hypothetical protein